MTTDPWIIGPLAAFDALIEAVLFLLLRLHPFPDRKSQVITAVALSGFGFHALIFFEGPILYLQLATLAAIYVGLALSPLRRPATESDHAQS
jgi:hypothetical protein